MDHLGEINSRETLMIKNKVTAVNEMKLKLKIETEMKKSIQRYLAQFVHK